MECRALSLGTFGDLNKLLQLGHQSEPSAVKAVRTQKLVALIVHSDTNYFYSCVRNLCACAISQSQVLSLVLSLLLRNLFSCVTSQSQVLSLLLRNLCAYDNTKIPISRRLEAIGRNTPSTYSYTTDLACQCGGISRRVALPDSHKCLTRSLCDERLRHRSAFYVK